MTAKIALLFLVHRQEDLDRIVKLYESPFFDLFVHVDAKSDVQIEQAQRSENIKFVEKCFDVFWAGYNMIEASLSLIRSAMIADQKYEFFALLSGDTLPAMPLQVLSDLICVTPTNRIELKEIANDSSLRNKPAADAVTKYGDRHEWRFQNFHFADSPLTCFRQDQSWTGRFGVSDHEFYRMRQGAGELLHAILTLLPSRKALFKQFFFGSQWWILTRSTLEKLRDEFRSEDVGHFFRFFEVPDEHFFHCLVGNHVPTNSHNLFSLQKPICYTTEGDQILDVERIKALFFSKGAFFGRRYKSGLDTKLDKMIDSGKYFDIFRDMSFDAVVCK